MTWPTVSPLSAFDTPRLVSNIAVHDVLANDEHVIALINVALRKPDGSEVAYPAIEVAHMSNGLIADGCPRDGPSSSRVLLM